MTGSRHLFGAVRRKTDLVFTNQEMKAACGIRRRPL
jgi:hypothetical protein